MNQKAALAKALLDGETLSIKNAYFELGISNIAREVSRGIEKPFGVYITKIQCKGHDRYGGDVVWFEYKLNRLIEDNNPGIEKMKAYVNEHFKNHK
jgi:hypothetical protein